MKPCPLGALLALMATAPALGAKDPVVAVPADAPSAVRIAAFDPSFEWIVRQDECRCRVAEGDERQSF